MGSSFTRSGAGTGAAVGMDGVSSSGLTRAAGSERAGDGAPNLRAPMGVDGRVSATHHEPDLTGDLSGCGNRGRSEAASNAPHRGRECAVVVEVMSGKHDEHTVDVGLRVTVKSCAEKPRQYTAASAYCIQSHVQVCHRLATRTRLLRARACTASLHTSR
jgi:hypothetical protein